MRRAIPLCALLSSALGAPAAADVRVLQQGRDGYAGARDTFVSRNDWASPPQYTLNYGRNPVLIVGRDGSSSALLRFDLDDIPPNAVVSSARLSLYNTTTPPSGAARRVKAYALLRSWRAGNQVASPLDAPGRRGATGVFAIGYFPGEGANVPWASLGLAAGADYASAAAAAAEVTGPGFYEWDLTPLVQEWIRRPATNHGIVLRDASGYQPFDSDERDLASSDAADAARRPRLTIDVDTETPFADAGPDVVDLRWSGQPVTLDGSASNDGGRGEDTNLGFEWRVVAAPPGSALAGAVLSPKKVATVLLDHPGEWDVELTVTNDRGRSATDRVHLQLLSVPASHPRIFLTPSRLQSLRSRAQPSNPRWARLLSAAGGDGSLLAPALAYQITGDVAYADRAIAAALETAPDLAHGRGERGAGEAALVYDWCHARLGAAQAESLRAALAAWARAHAAKPDNDLPGWNNYWPRYGYSYALMGLATLGESPEAAAWMDEYRHRRYRDTDQAMLDKVAAGGGWPEGTVYDAIANLWRLEAVEAWRTATGEDLFETTAWYRERLGFLLLSRRPGLVEDASGYRFHDYTATGDSERNRGPIMAYTRMMGLLLVQRFADDPRARELQAYLAATPDDAASSPFPDREFLWFDPAIGGRPPSRLVHWAAGTGTLLARSGWPRGAADDSAEATLLGFQCGDHFSYHQHYDQNSFTLFKGADLLVDSGVYSGEGLSSHDVNYYARTIAHNTLVVRNPAEDFSSARPDARSNDGGQRTFYPASRAPASVAEWDEMSPRYDLCDLRAFEDAPSFTYARGDATKAYNGPGYNQAEDTTLAGNEAKVARFERELVYLRPPASSAREYLVVYDRVAVTRDVYSGASTKLLFHFRNEPAVEAPSIAVEPGETLYPGAGAAVAAAGDAKVFARFLLPATRNLRKVGGRGEKAFWVDGENYDWHWSPDEPQPRPTTEFDTEPYGEWRLELEPADTALEHAFLTVLHPATARTRQMPPVEAIEGERLAGAHIADPSENRVVLFSSAPDGSAPAGVLAYRFRPTAASRHVIADLAPGARYARTLRPTRDGIGVRLVPDPEGGDVVSPDGTLSFTLGPSGQ